MLRISCNSEADVIDASASRSNFPFLAAMIWLADGLPMSQWPECVALYCESGRRLSVRKSKISGESRVAGKSAFECDVVEFHVSFPFRDGNWSISHHL